MPSVQSIPEATISMKQAAMLGHVAWKESNDAFLLCAYSIAGSWNHWKHGDDKCKLQWVDCNWFFYFWEGAI